MELLDLENLAQKEKITINNFKMNNHKARIIKYNGCHIFMDYRRINTYTEEKCLLAEELGHYYYDGYYTFKSNQLFIDKQEYKALKWKSLACVPLNSILNCFLKGICNLWDIAKELNVEPNMVEFAYDYYKENGKLICEQENII